VLHEPARAVRPILGARGNVQLGADHALEQEVAGQTDLCARGSRIVLTWVLQSQDQVAVQAERPCGNSHGPAMVALQPPASDDAIRALLQGIRKQKLKLAHLVA